MRDLTVGGRPVLLELEVRRFFCDNRTCPARTFVEQVPQVSRPHARRTRPLQVALQAVGLALAGRAGQRLAARFGLLVSRSTLIRLVHAMPDPPVGAIRILGVDDFATRRGHRYGTILIDMDTHRPVDVLPDRTTETLTAWLKGHPGIEVVCRDRAGSYADAALKGAPEAVQCADRWHLWHNLIEAVERTVSRHRSCLREPEPLHPPGEQPEPWRAARQGSSRFADRTRAKHARIHELKNAGHSLRAISRMLGMTRNTVTRYAGAATPDDLLWGQWTAKPSVVDDFKPYLHQRWSEGERNATRLLEEITALGYQGSYAALRDYLRPLRTPRPISAPEPSVRKVTGWIAAHPDHLDEAHHLRLKTVLARCPELAALAGHVRAFAAMMTKKDGDQLPAWLQAVRHDDLPALHTFASGIERDLDAVTAGLTLKWSSGPVEGQVNRIKMLKRQMFGRAGFPLLRKRILLPN
ncbi:ISL3 family transposase [Actinocorallia libanotica]|uniref:ISL3 family transposase n=1 Tax=Actinocorallia libanotica TaxID=46162 RepID=A0ABN1RVT7_9ACTN